MHHQRVARVSAFVAMGLAVVGSLGISRAYAEDAGQEGYFGWACQSGESANSGIDATIWRNGEFSGIETDAHFSIRVFVPLPEGQSHLIAEVSQVRETIQGNDIVFQGDSLEGGIQVSISKQPFRPFPELAEKLTDPMEAPHGLPSILKITRILVDDEPTPEASAYEVWCSPTR